MLSLHLLRHSNAEDMPPAGETDDRTRRLTDEGIDKARAIGRALNRMELKFDLILTSPAVRARHTAELVAATLGTPQLVELCDGLLIGGSLRAVGAQILNRRRAAEQVLIVGHEPDLGRIASLLLAGNRQVNIAFKKGGLSKLVIPKLKYGRCATLEWHLTPRQLRMIAK